MAHFVNELLSFGFNLSMCPVQKYKVGGKCAYGFTEVPELQKYIKNKRITACFTGFMCFILHKSPVAIDTYKQFGDESFKFSIYCAAKNKYVVSFQTLKLPGYIIDNSGNKTDTDSDMD